MAIDEIPNTRALRKQQGLVLSLANENHTAEAQSTMFLLGHSCWSYLISKATGRQLRVNPPLYLALLAGVLPDFDIYLQPLIPTIHHTYTHSVLVLGPIIAILTIRYKRAGAAFSAGLLSHLLTDYLVGEIPPLYPLSANTIGLNLGIGNLSDTILEVGALLLVIAYAYINKDYLQFTRPNKDSLLMAITLTSIVTLTLLFAGDNKISIAALAFSRRALTLISVAHVFEAGALTLGTIQGLRAYLTPKQQEAHQTIPSPPL